MPEDGGPVPAGDLRRNGHVIVRGALDDTVVHRALAAARHEVEREVADALARGATPAPDYQTAIQLRERDPALAAVVCSPELARLAAAALGVDGVRLLYDQVFVKPPGATCTVWHQDQVYWPIDTSDVLGPGAIGAVRCWVTLTDLPADVGGLHFVDRSHDLGPLDLRSVGIAPPGAGRTATVADRELSITDYGPLVAGDATLHAGFTLHGSRHNPTDDTRVAVAVAYVPDGARVAEPTDVHQEWAIHLHVPGRRPGDLIDTDDNPVLWPPAGA